VKVEVEMQGNLNSNIMESSDKVCHRTHHTRFFEKLYGNLEKSSDKKDEIEENKCNYSMSIEREVVSRREVLNSPSESSGSSSEIYQNDLNVSRCENYDKIKEIFRSNSMNLLS
jgi:hypothetical protein